jgi:hypothetical protein
MNGADRPVWFVGDLDDPWVASLADALPSGTRLFNVAGTLAGDWPEAVLENAPSPRVVVLHRPALSPSDAERLERLRPAASARAPGGPGPAPRIILCFGPYVRHADLERWLARGTIDAIVPEATARDTLGRHLFAGETDGVLRRRGGPRPAVAVVSAHFELRSTLADACEALGYPAEPLADWAEVRTAGPALWDVPVLEHGWTADLARRAGLGSVAVLLGFASRQLVGQARAHGAAACLELPYDLLDLGHVLDRITAPRGDPPHTVPPPPAAARQGQPKAPAPQHAPPGGRPGPGGLE